MKRREWMLLLGGSFFAGCRREGPVVDAPVEERKWIDMRNDWEGISGGEVDGDEPLRIGWGESITTVKWQGDVPEPPFEMKLMAKRLDGTDFFCAITFPVRNGAEFVSLVIGGWGGSVVGISSVDGKDASQNETTSYRKFETDVWYQIHLVNRKDRISVWIDGEKAVDLDTVGKNLTLRDGQISDCVPFGLATWQTTGLIGNIRWRPI